MKKLLTILTLALVLCLLCSAAFAGSIGTVYGGKFETEAEFTTQVTAGYKINDTTQLKDVKSTTLADAKENAVHGDYTNVFVTATIEDAKGNDQEVEILFKVLLSPHEFDAGKVTKKPTCTEKGELTKSCKTKGCTETKVEEIAPLGHKWEYEILKDATCTEKGSKQLKCSICGELNGDPVEIPTLTIDGKHQFANTTEAKYWSIISKPICRKESQVADVPGKYVKNVCSICHTVNPDGKKLDMTMAQYQTYLTKIGSDEKYDGHDWDKWNIAVIPATCAEGPKDQRWCKRCNLIENRLTEGGKKLDEDYQFLKLDPEGTLDCEYDGKAIFRCVNCLSVTHPDLTIIISPLTDADPKEFKDSTGKVSLTVAHKFTEEVSDSRKAVNPAKGETWTTGRDIKKIACGDETWAQFKCTVCGTLTEKKVADAKAHVFGDWEVYKEGETPETKVWIRYCKNCTFFETKAQANKPVECTGKHDWYPVDFASLKCEDDNVGTKLKCKNCDMTKTDKWPLKHDFQDVSVIKEATCIAEGSKVQTCAQCKTVQIVAIEIIPHNIVEVAETPATCAATGLKAAFKCDACGKLFSDKEGKTEITAQEVIPATGEHTWNDGEVVTAATCTKEGKKLITCTVCGLTKTEAIEKIAHTPVEVAEVPATCKDTGVKAGKKCSVCGEELEGFEVIPADETAHVWEEEVLVEATCTKAGTALKTCSVCGKTEKVEIEKLAHTWDEGKITKEATKEAKGEKTYTCTACGETKTEEVEYVVTAAPKYSVTGLTYDGQTLKGKLAHDEDTLEAETLNVRVTFFMTGNYYMATIGEVAADGSFSVDGVGPIEYISVVATGSSSVNPDDVVALGSGEITVK